MRSADVRSSEMSGSEMSGAGTSGCETKGAAVEGAIVTGGQGAAPEAAEERPAEEAASAGQGPGDLVAGALPRGGAAPPTASPSALPVLVPGKALARLRAQDRARRREAARNGHGARASAEAVPVRLVVVESGQGPEPTARGRSSRPDDEFGPRRTAGRRPGSRGDEGTRRHRRRTTRARTRRDAGMATSEYAMALLAAVAFAGVLYKIVTGDAVASALQSAVEKALDAPF
ncbi:DUF4244 domain-containing protein [Streptomyces sp. GF20]|nr:DUF4244 domain-containing protein [Streptomyces sp. GF20]QHC16998.1 DUF4244 domain-containing protein [Streptomyces sp. GF20]